MTYSKEEIEKTIGELKERDLYVAKQAAIGISNLVYTSGLVFYTTADEIKSYANFWSKKLEATHNEIAESQTLEETFEILKRFYEEHAAYISAERVRTAAEAMDIAHTFIKKYSPVALPVKALKEDDVWLVDIDVGALSVKIAKVKVDAKTGDILSYEIPEK